MCYAGPSERSVKYVVLKYFHNRPFTIHMLRYAMAASPIPFPLPYWDTSINDGCVDREDSLKPILDKLEKENWLSMGSVFNYNITAYWKTRGDEEELASKYPNSGKIIIHPVDKAIIERHEKEDRELLNKICEEHRAFIEQFAKNE